MPVHFQAVAVLHTLYQCKRKIVIIKGLQYSLFACLLLCYTAHTTLIVYKIRLSYIPTKSKLRFLDNWLADFVKTFSYLGERLEVHGFYVGEPQDVQIELTWV